MEKSSQSKFHIFFSYFSVQDFLDKAKKEFDEKWSINLKVRRKTNKLLLIDWHPLSINY